MYSIFCNFREELYISPQLFEGWLTFTQKKKTRIPLDSVIRHSNNRLRDLCQVTL